MPTTLFCLHWGKANRWLCLHAGGVMPVLFLMLQQCQIVSCVRWVMSHSSCHIEVEQPCWLRLCFSHHWLTARLPKSSRGLSTKAGFLPLRLVLARFCWVEASALDFLCYCWLWPMAQAALASLRNHLKVNTQITNPEAYAVRSLENAVNPLLPSWSQKCFVFRHEMSLTRQS